MLRLGTSCGGFKESLKPWLPLGPLSILCTQQCCIHLLWYKVGAFLPYQGLSLLQAVSTPSLGQGKTQKSGQQRLYYLFRNHSTDTRSLVAWLVACFVHKLYWMLFPMSRVFHEESTQGNDEPGLKRQKQKRGLTMPLWLALNSQRSTYLIQIPQNTSA